MKRFIWAAPFVFFVVFAFHPATAAAALHVCNKTDHRIDVAVATLIGDCKPDCYAHTKGWWTLEPGACKIPIGGELDTSGDTLYYYYAQDSNGGTWTGTFSLCVDPQNAFDYDDNQNANCSGSHRSFRRINVGDNADFTVSLSP